VILGASQIQSIRLVGGKLVHPRADALDLGCPQNHADKSSNFKPVSSATKVMKIGPEATPNHEKWILKS
jgi:hypothetical protein